MCSGRQTDRQYNFYKATQPRSDDSDTFMKDC